MIPKKFRLMAHTFSVNIIEKQDWDDDSIRGDLDPQTHEIRLLKYCDSATAHTFYHELVHAILMAMNDDKNTDEKFVDVFAGLLHQAVESFDYEDPKGSS